MKALNQKLFDIKGKIGKISKDSTNPFFNSKYFDINELLEHLEPLLRDEKLLLLQPCENGGVTSRIIDLESGESVESSLPLPALNDPQKIGSCVTYYRRYTLGSLLSTQAEDDDANKAAGKAPAKIEKTPVDVWMNEKQFQQALADPEKAKKALEWYDNKTSQQDGKVYGMKKDYRTQLQKA